MPASAGFVRSALSDLTKQEAPTWFAIVTLATVF